MADASRIARESAELRAASVELRRQAYERALRRRLGNEAAMVERRIALEHAAAVRALDLRD